MIYENMAYLGLRAILERFRRSGTNVFAVGDVAKAMHKPAAYASLVLSTSERVKRLARGLYYTNDASPYELASNVVYPSYVSLAAALQYYDLIDQNVILYSVITPRRHKPITLSEGRIEFATTSKERIFGYIPRGNSYIASPEKTFVDCLYFGKPDFSQLEVSFASALEDRVLDTAKLKRYAIKMRSKSIMNKLGFLLELYNVPADDILKYTYRAGYVRIWRSVKGSDKKWRVSYDRRK